MDWLQINQGICLLTGIFALGVGIGAVIRPQPASKAFGIEVDGSALPFVMATGARDIYLGLITLVLCWYGDLQVLGANFICIAVLAMFDFILTFRKGSRRHSAIHLGGAVFALAYGIFLI